MVCQKPATYAGYNIHHDSVRSEITCKTLYIRIPNFEAT